jgi:hypothetical protein
MTKLIGFLCKILFRRSVLYSLIHSIASSLVTFSDHFIFSILFQHHILKLFKYFSSNFNILVYEPYSALLQT